MKILVVDDSKAISKLLSDMLSSHGYEVISMHSVDTAIAALEDKKNAIRLVITDLIMPERDGMDLIDHIHNHFAPANKPKIVAISGGSKGTVTAETAVISIKDKVDHVLVKPFSQEVFLETVKTLLA